jgi:TPR repeat protein
MKNVKKLYLGIAFANVWTASASAARITYSEDVAYWEMKANAGDSEARRLVDLRQGANAGNPKKQLHFAIYLNQVEQNALAGAYLQMAKDQGIFGDFPDQLIMQILAAAGFREAGEMLGVYDLLDDPSPENLFRIAECFSDAGLFQDMKIFFSYMHLAADAEYSDAYFYCMRCLARGLGCTKDLAAARRYGQMAEAAGCNVSMWRDIVHGED